MNNQSRALTILTFNLLIVFFAARRVAGQEVPKANAGDRDQPVVLGNQAIATADDTLPVVQKREWRYRIHTSDTLELTFLMTPEFNQTMTVQPDGYITLRAVGELPAAGHTLPELTESVKMAYSKILHDPVMSLDPKDFEKPYFIVGGQVAKPGKFDLRGDVTLTQAIAMAGGLTDAAKHSQVLLFRRVSDQWTQASIVNMKKMLNARNLQEDPVLQPGDMLYVPKSALSKIKPFLPTASAGAYYNPASY